MGLICADSPKGHYRHSQKLPAATTVAVHSREKGSSCGCRRAPPGDQPSASAVTTQDGILDDLLAAYDAAISRRGDGDWPGRPRAIAAFEIAKSEQAARGTDPLGTGLRQVARRFGLDDLDTRLLAVAVAAEADPNLHLLTGLLAGDDGPGRPTAALALELVGVPTLSPGARSRLAEIAPLRRCGLVGLVGDSVLLSRRMKVADRVVAQVLGDDLPPADLLPLVIESIPVDVEGTDTIAAALSAGHRLVWVHAPIGSAGTAMAAAACRSLDVICLTADLERRNSTRDGGRAAGGSTVRAQVAALVLEAGLTGAVLILAGADGAPDAIDLLEESPVPVIAVGSSPWDRSWSSALPVSVTAPRLTIAERERLWWPVLGGVDAGRDIAALRLTPEEITMVGRHSTELAGLSGGGVTPALIRQAARRLGRSRSSKVAAGTTSAALEDLVLPGETAAEVARLLDWARYRDEVLAQGPLQGKGGKGSGICALFSGSPGTGKTLAAHVVADTLGMDLFSVDLPAVVDKYIGETEKNLERVFVEAESLNAVLFFDEADSLFGSRSEVKDAKDRYANQEVAYLLQRMEQFDGITVLATNLRGNLDPAFSRRLHFVIHFPDPDVPTRRRLWLHHLGNLPVMDPDDPVDIDELAASVELAGGDIRNIVLSTAYAAVAAGEAVGMRHLAVAIVREYAKLGRRVPDRQFLRTQQTSTAQHPAKKRENR